MKFIPTLCAIILLAFSWNSSVVLCQDGGVHPDLPPDLHTHSSIRVSNVNWRMDAARDRVLENDYMSPEEKHTTLEAIQKLREATIAHEIESEKIKTLLEEASGGSASAELAKMKAEKAEREAELENMRSNLGNMMAYKEQYHQEL
mmetsp:Transcript_18921/g.27320  ORF Transcript_18921/g.27320 Transcript_18921/m.27320 type:complete len:146 (-) Transcript_18921:56-493(-)